MLVLLAPLADAPEARAERKNFFGFTCDFMGGAGNQAGSNFNLARLQEGIAPFYSVYPSASLKSLGQHSSIDIGYTFIGERHEMDPALTTTAHAVTAALNAQLSKRVGLRLTESFNTAPDFSTINVLKGFIFTPEGFQYVFEPQLFERRSLRNHAGIGLDVELNTQSQLHFTASGSYLRYDDTSGYGGWLQDQLRTEGSFAYARQRTEHQTWTTKYTVHQNDYIDRVRVRTHAATLGLAQQVKPTVRLTVEGGPSFTEKIEAQDPYFGYVALMAVEKQIRGNRLFANYSHRSGDSTGLGEATDIDSGALGFLLRLGRNGSLSLDGSAFRQEQRNTGLYNYWGVRGAVALSRNLGTRWVAGIGASYQSYQGRSGTYQNLDYKRVYASIGFRLPERQVGR